MQSLVMLRRRWYVIGAAACLALIVMVAAPGARDQRSDQDALIQRVRSLEARINALEVEIAELKRLIAGAGKEGTNKPPAMLTPTPPPVKVMSVAGAPSKGRPDAPLTIIEFSDYECGFCGRHARETIPQLDREFVQPGRVRYVFRSFPNEAGNKLALKAHEAAACAGDQGKYWGMHDRLFAQPGTLQPPRLSVHAQALGLSMTPFQQCLDSSKYRDHIRQETAMGRAAGVTATPTFFFATPGPSPDQVRVVRMLRGAKAFQVFKDTIEQVLAGK